MQAFLNAFAATIAEDEHMVLVVAGPAGTAARLSMCRATHARGAVALLPRTHSGRTRDRKSVSLSSPPSR
jgi:hypothetical protein